MISIKLLKEIKLGNTSKFYTSRTWRKKATEIRQRDNNECQNCKKQGRFSKAECVHHKKELKDYPEFALKDDNLISLCSTCHNKIHEKFQHNHNKKKYINKELW